MYSGGQNTKNAQAIEFGTESVGTTICPPRQRAWPSTGWLMRPPAQPVYIGTNSTYASYWDSLSPDIRRRLAIASPPFDAGGTDGKCTL